MKYLSAEDILVLHALVVDEIGGSHGVRDTHLLQSIVHKSRTRSGGKELYPGVFLKAAVLFEAVATYHVFVDGNKRTALIATSRFLAINGYELTAANKDAEDITLSVATKNTDVHALAVWFKKHSRKTRRR